jgi:predicted  nucleic acid-binding Zn-ribbon protein
MRECTVNRATRVETIDEQLQELERRYDPYRTRLIAAHAQLVALRRTAIQSDPRLIAAQERVALFRQQFNELQLQIRLLE